MADIKYGSENDLINNNPIRNISQQQQNINMLTNQRYTPVSSSVTKKDIDQLQLTTSGYYTSKNGKTEFNGTKTTTTNFYKEPPKETGERVITPSDHFINLSWGNTDRYKGITTKIDNTEFFSTPTEHFIYDPNDVKLQKEEYKTYPVKDPKDAKSIPKIKKFSGATTLLNSENNAEKAEMLKDLESYDKEYLQRLVSGSIKEAPLSALRPFTNMDPKIAHNAIFASYNRTLLPVADVEFRKAYKTVMFSRPECYIMSINGKPSQQVENDVEFMSTYSRLPHLLQLLSPSYLDPSTDTSASIFSPNDLKSNWNYLLSNRLLSFNDDMKTSIGVVDNTMKSIEGHTVTPGRTLESVQGGTIQVTFRETKNLEVYEFLRLWMLYIHKIRKGIFSPSYNGYQYQNSFLPIANNAVAYSTMPCIIYHPYDRALDYTASIFEIITNETMSKIIGWQKWYGLFPVEATLNGLGEGLAVTGELTVSATFRYQKKEPNSNRTIIEFNYNAGMCDDLGRVSDRKFYQVRNCINAEKPNKGSGDSRVNQFAIPRYGATDMFTGTPYIVYGKTQNNPVGNDHSTLTPYLKFTGVNRENVNLVGVANASLVSPLIEGDIESVISTEDISSEIESSSNIPSETGDKNLIEKVWDNTGGAIIEGVNDLMEYTAIGRMANSISEGITNLFS